MKFLSNSIFYFCIRWRKQHVFEDFKCK